MKKVIILLLIVLTIPVTVLSEESLFVVNILGNYCFWAEMVGASDVSTEPDVSQSFTDDQVLRMTVDMLTVYCDKNTYEFNYAMFTYRHPEYSDAELDLRALGLFIAIEYGKPQQYDQAELKQTKEEAMSILNALKKALKEKESKINDGYFVPFYIGSKTTYSIYQPSTGYQVIHIE